MTTLDVAGRLAEIAALQSGWLDGDGEAVAPAALACARRVLPSIAAGSWGRPRIYPTPEGGIRAEWSFDGAESCVVFAPDGRMTAEGPTREALAADPLAPVYRWLVEDLAFPFDLHTDEKPPWLNLTVLAGAWHDHDAREHDGRTETVEDWAAAILSETGWAEEGSAS